MSSLSAKDRVSLCSFTFSDGRRCRTPRTGKNSRFCAYHAQKEAQARATQNLGKDLAYFFSGNYLSACDLSTALTRLIPAVVCGDVKPKTARTVAYLLQTLLQSIHISQHEYINAFGTEGWRQSVRNSVNSNQNYLFPPTPHSSGGLQAGPAPQPEHPIEPQLQPQPAPPQSQSQPTAPPIPAAVTHPFRGEAFPSTRATSPAHPQTQSQQPVLVVHPSCPEETRRVRGEASPSASSPQPAATPIHPANIPPPQPAHIPAGCHSACPDLVGERSDERPTSGASPESYREKPAFSRSPTPSPTSAHAPQTQSTPSATPAPRPNIPPCTGPPASQPAPSRDTHALHFDHNYRLRIDGKPF
jgi:hypothetical protein